MHFIDNIEEKKFETEIEGYKAFIEYSVAPDVLTLEHTEVAKELSGRGIASELTEAVLLQIESRGLKVIPHCPFIKGYIEKHPEWKFIVA